MATVLVSKDATAGSVDLQVYVDGGLLGSLSLPFDADEEIQVPLLFRTGLLPGGTHTVVLTIACPEGQGSGAALQTSLFVMVVTR